MTVTNEAPTLAPDHTGRAARVREATATQHRSTETRSFITDLMGGKLSLAAYTAYLAQFAYVYRALESRNPAPADPHLITDTRLHRMAAIEADLAALGAPDWEDAHPALPATQAYVERLLAVAHDVPRYLAHHYTRYLGDLSGGQAIAALVERHYGATPEQLGFYRFEGIDTPVRFKRAYREALDALELNATADAAFIEEACAAFTYNGAIFDELLDVTDAAAPAARA